MRFSDERVWFRAPLLPFPTLWSCWVPAFRLQPGGLRITSDMTLLVEQDAVCNIFQVLRYDVESGCAPFHLFFELILSSSPNAAKKPVPWSPSLSPLFRCPRDLHELLSTACWSAKLLDSQLCSLGHVAPMVFPQCDSDHPTIRNSCGKGMKYNQNTSHGSLQPWCAS